GMFRSGDMTGHVIEGPLNVRVVGVKRTFYYYVNKTFFSYLHAREHVPLSACKQICGKYIPVSSAKLAKFTLGNLVRQIETGLPVPVSVPSIRATTYQGQAAYELSNDKGQEVFVAKNGTHYLLGMVDPGKFRLTFSQWNAVPPVSAPPASKIFRG